MWKFFVWPVISSLLFLNYRQKNIGKSCAGELFIGSCDPNLWFITIMMGESLIFYSILAIIAMIATKNRHKTLPFFIFVFIGIISFLIVCGFFIWENMFTLWFSSPFAILAFFIQWKFSLH